MTLEHVAILLLATIKRLSELEKVMQQAPTRRIRKEKIMAKKKAKAVKKPSKGSKKMC
jgi:hypothetical protein